MFRGAWESQPQRFAQRHCPGAPDPWTSSFLSPQTLTFSSVPISSPFFMNQTVHGRNYCLEAKTSEQQGGDPGLALYRVAVCSAWVPRCVWLSTTPSVLGILPGKNTGVSCRFLLQGVFLTQGSSLRILHNIGRRILCHWVIWEASFLS